MIPKYVIRTGSKQHVQNRLIKAADQKLKQNNPDWTFLQFDDEACDEFMSLHFNGEIYSAYQKINVQYGVARADLFRYCAMYVHGGIYLDIKSTAALKLDSISLKSDKYLLSQWDNRPGEMHHNWGIHPELKLIPGGEFQQWFIATTPNNPILKAVIEQVCRNIFSFPNSTANQSGKNAVLQLTGPIPYTLAIASMISKRIITNGQDFRYISSQEKGLIYSIFEINDPNRVFDLTGERFSAQELIDLTHMHSQLHYGGIEAPVVNW